MCIAVKVSGSYQAPYGILASAVVQHYTGFPELTTVVVGPATVDQQPVPGTEGEWYEERCWVPVS